MIGKYGMGAVIDADELFVMSKVLEAFCDLTERQKTFVYPEYQSMKDEINATNKKAQRVMADFAPDEHEVTFYYMMRRAAAKMGYIKR